MPLQKLVGNVYSVAVEVLLWVIPIAGFVAAGILGASLSWRGSDFHVGYAFAGLVAGFILDVILCGPAIVFLNIRASLKNIEDK